MLDVDGVLTDGRIILGSGGMEFKFFDSQDGMGITLAQQAGLKIAIITGRESEAVSRRAVELKIDDIFQNCPDKLPPYLQLLNKYGLTDEEATCVADDLIDLPILRRAGFKVAVGNAVEEVKEMADYVTEAKGGRGAVREVVDLILEAQEKQGGKEPEQFLNHAPMHEESDMCIEKAKEVIRLEAEAVAALENRIGLEFKKAVDIILNSKGRVIVSGIGKSGIIAKKIAATLSSTGTSAIFLHPAEGVHGDLGMVRRYDVVIGISKSGESDEFYQLLSLFKRLGVPIIAITGNGDSLLAKQSDVVLDVSVEREACPHNLTPTTSTTAALALGDALAIALLYQRGLGQEGFAFFHPGGNPG